MHNLSALAGAEMVVAEFGAWPSFHDAEVLSFELERSSLVATSSAVARMKVHVRRYEPSNEGTAEYHLALVKSVVIAFRFTGIEALEVSEFNHQNVIDSIAVSEASTPSGARISVEVESIFGFGGQWRCRTAEVVSVVCGPSEA